MTTLDPRLPLLIALLSGERSICLLEASHWGMARKEALLSAAQPLTVREGLVGDADTPTRRHARADALAGAPSRGARGGGCGGEASGRARGRRRRPSSGSDRRWGTRVYEPDTRPVPPCQRLGSHGESHADPRRERRLPRLAPPPPAAAAAAAADRRSPGRRPRARGTCQRASVSAPSVKLAARSCHETRGRHVGDLRAVRGHPTARAGGAPRWGSLRLSQRARACGLAAHHDAQLLGLALAPVQTAAARVSPRVWRALDALRRRVAVG